MFFLFLFAFGDFQYTAPSGAWLDYARSGPLSENRYLVVEHIGSKGQYDLGVTQKVLDESGHFLYDIPVAENAWMVRNGIFDDEDTFFYQNRGEKSFFLWKPGKAPVELVFTSENNEVRPGINGKLLAITIQKNGSRFVFVSELLETSEAETPSAKTIVEVLTLKEPLVWNNGTLAVDAYVSASIDTGLLFDFHKNSMILYHELRHSRTYFTIDLESEISRNLPMVERKAAYPIYGLKFSGNYLSYFTRIYEPGSSKFETVFVVQRIGSSEPVLAFSEKDKNEPGYSSVFELFRAFERGAIEEEDGILSFAKDGIKKTFNPATGQLKHFEAPWAGKGFTRAIDALSVQCDHRSLRVKHLSGFQEKQTEAILVIDCTPFKQRN